MHAIWKSAGTFLLLAAACSSSETGPKATGAGPSGGASSGGGGSADPGGLSVSFDPVTVAPGQERTQCVVKNLGNPSAMHVGRIHNVLGQGSHHVIVYRTNDTAEQTTPVDCQPFTDTLHPDRGSPLMVTQKQDDSLTLPAGVGYSLQPNQMIRLEMHYINATAGDLDVTATSTFFPIADDEFENEADFLFLGNPDISIAAHSTESLGPTFLKLPENLAGARVFGLTGHTHQWGTNVTVATASGKMGPDTPVYDVPDWKWSEPATVYHDPPLELPPGAGFHFTCSWNNTSDHPVGFGESANDEMCFFWAYYYPSKGAFVCAHTDQVPGGLDLCCPGDPLCSQLLP